MSRALVLLIWLRDVAGWRFFWKSGRGSLIALLAKLWIFAILLVFALGWLTALRHSLSSGQSAPWIEWLRSVVRGGAALAVLPFLLLLVVIGVLAAFEKPFRLSPTEVDFLVAGPFRRHQLVNYKIGTALYGQVWLSLLFAPSIAAVSGLIPAFVGYMLLLGFLHLFAIVAASLGTMLGLNEAAGLRRSLISVVFLGAVVAVLWVCFGNRLANPIDAYLQVDRSVRRWARRRPCAGSSRSFWPSGSGPIWSGGQRSVSS